jgi:hypothetical protein
MQTIQFWAHFFNEKRKKQFIPMPMRVGEINVKSISHLDEFFVYFDSFKMREIHEFEGFDPDGLFSAHMFSIGYGSSFTKSLQLDEGGGDNQNPQENFPGSHQLPLQDDINTLVSTNDQYRQRG